MESYKTSLVELKNNIDYIDQVIVNMKQYSPAESNFILNGVLNRRDIWKGLDDRTLETLKGVDFEIKSLPVLVGNFGSSSSNNNGSGTNLGIQNPSCNENTGSKIIIRIWDSAGAAFKTLSISANLSVKDTLIAAFKKFKLAEADLEKYVLAESSLTGDKILEMGELMLPIYSGMEEFNDREKDEYNHKKIILRTSHRKGVIRVYLRDDVHFKTFNIDEYTASDKLIGMAMQKFGIQGVPDNFELVEIFNNAQKVLKPDDKPLIMKLDWEKKKLDNLVRYTLRETLHGETLVSSQEVSDSIAGNKSNLKCADCEADDPSFVSVNLGITLCLNCAMSHIKNHGSIRPNIFVSKIRPIKFYTWKKENLKILLARGNDKSNSFFLERSIDVKARPNESYCDVLVKEKYIRQVATQSLLLPDYLAEDTSDVDKFLEDEFRKSISQGALNDALNLLIWGLDPNQSINLNMPFLHKACYKGKGAFIELLLSYGANPLIKDVQGKTPLYYLFAKNFEALALQMKEYQIYYEAIKKGVDLTKPPSYLTLKRLTQMSDDDFNVLLSDTMNEINRRTHMISGTEAKADIAFQKLSSLTDSNLRDLADTVFDELNIREFRRLNETIFTQQRSRTDLNHDIGYEWLDTLKTGQIIERNDATAEREMIVRRMNEIERTESNRESKHVMKAKLNINTSDLQKQPQQVADSARFNSVKLKSSNEEIASKSGNIKKALLEAGMEMKQKISPIRQVSLPTMVMSQYRSPEDISEDIDEKAQKELKEYLQANGIGNKAVPLKGLNQVQFPSAAFQPTITKVDISKQQQQQQQQQTYKRPEESARDDSSDISGKIEDINLLIYNTVVNLINQTKTLIFKSKEQRLGECIALSSEVIKTGNEVIKLWRDLLQEYPDSVSKNNFRTIGEEIVVIIQSLVQSSKDTPMSPQKENVYYENIRNNSVNLLKKTRALVEFITEEQRKTL